VINRRKFMNVLVSGVGGTCLFPWSKVLAGGENNKSGDAGRIIKINGRYLNFPVRNGADSRHLTLLVDGKVAREFDIELVETNPEWWAFTDVSQFQGKSVTLRIDEPAEGFRGLASIIQANEIADAENLYRETRRPQFHFSTRRGWLNDKNGLVYYQGISSLLPIRSLPFYGVELTQTLGPCCQ